MIHEFTMKTAIPAECLNEIRVEQIQKNHVEIMLKEINEYMYDGGYELLITHNSKYIRKYGYFEITTDISLEELDEEEDTEEVEEDDDM